jgi:hypothetical protein
MTDEDREICRASLECLQNEKPNFEYLLSGRPFSKDTYHKKAVTQYSFEKVRDAMRKLCFVRGFGYDANEISKLVEEQLARSPEERDPAQILALIEPTMRRLSECI